MAAKNSWWFSDTRRFLWKTIEQIGGASFAFMVPILAGYIAYSIADKPGLVPGMIGGYIAATGSFMVVRVELVS